MEHVTPIMLRVEPRGHSAWGGHTILLNGELVAWRPYDGSDTEDVLTEVIGAFGEMLREKLGRLRDVPPETDEYHE